MGHFPFPFSLVDAAHVCLYYGSVCSKWREQQVQYCVGFKSKFFVVSFKSRLQKHLKKWKKTQSPLSVPHTQLFQDSGTALGWMRTSAHSKACLQIHTIPFPAERELPKGIKTCRVYPMITAGMSCAGRQAGRQGITVLHH